MKELIEETIILVPGAVLKKAKELFHQGLIEAAIRILEQNKVECKVYTKNVERKRQRQLRAIS